MSSDWGRGGDDGGQRPFYGRNSQADIGGERTWETSSQQDSPPHFYQPQEDLWTKIKKQPPWLYGVLLLSILMFLAGAIMLGIGIHNNNKNKDTTPLALTCPTPAAQTIRPYYATVTFTSISYDDVQKNYEGTAKNIRDLISRSMQKDMLSSSKRSILASLSPEVDILGISKADGQGVNVISALIFPSDVSSYQVQAHLESMESVQVNQVTGDSVPASNSSQLCTVVSDFYAPVSTTTGGTSPGTPPTPSQTGPTVTTTSGLTTQTPNNTETTSSNTNTMSSTTNTSTATTTNGTGSTLSSSSQTTTSPDSTNVTTVTGSLPTQPVTQSTLNTTTSLIGTSATTTSTQNTSQTINPFTTVTMTTIFNNQSTQTSPTQTSSSQQTSNTTTPLTTVPMTQTTTLCISPTTSNPGTPTSPPSPNVRDLILLIDSSNSLNSTQFDMMKHFIINDLIPVLTVDTDSLLVAAGEYDQRHFNLYDAFDVYTNAELIQIVDADMIYEGRYNASITNVLKRVNVLHSTRTNAPRSILLITASSDPVDIIKATPYANVLKNSSNDYLLILGIGGSTDLSLLIGLTSGPGYAFSDPQISGGSELAGQLVDAIYGRTTPVTTSPSPTAPFACNPDVAILFDSSIAVGSEAEFSNQVMFFVDRVISQWIISPADTETAAAIYTKETTQVFERPYQYKTTAEFQRIVSRYSDDYYAGHASIKNGLSLLKYFTQQDSRGHNQTAILITYSSDYSDVIASIPLVQGWGGNLIVLGIGNQTDADLLGALSGNVIIKMVYDDDIITQLNQMMCSPNPPHDLSTTTSVISSSSTTKPSSPTTRFTEIPATTSTPTVSPCADCFPEMSSLLVVFDASSGYDNSDYRRVLYFLANTLFPLWNHWERVAIAAFADHDHYVDLADYTDLHSAREAGNLIIALAQINGTADLTNALRQSLHRYHPLAQYGIQHTIVFTSASANITQAQPYADGLRALGSLTIVGVMYQDMTDFVPLVTDGDAIPWPDTKNSTGLADLIDATLGPPASTSTTLRVTSTSASQWTGTSTTASSTVPVTGTGSTSSSVVTVTSNGSTASTLSTVTGMTGSSPGTGSTASSVIPITNNGSTSTSSSTVTGTSSMTSSPVTTGTGSTASTPPPATETTTVVTTSQPTTTPSCSSCCQRAIILLIDESMDVPQDSFDQYKTFLTSLVSPWLISRDQFSVSVLVYTKSLVDAIATFDVKTVDELKLLINANVNWQSIATSGITKVLHAASDLSPPVREGITTILVTSSSKPDDMQSAIPYAYMLRQNGSTVVTISINADASMMASSNDFAFQLNVSLNGWENMIDPVNQVLCNQGPPPPTTTTIPVTTTSNLITTTIHSSPFDCQPDITIMIDGSSAVIGAEDGVRQMTSFIVNPLALYWPIMLNHTEAAIYFYSAMGNLVLGGNTYEYVDYDQFADALTQHGDLYYGGPASISKGIDFMLGHERWQRGHPRVILLFTWSSDYTDIAQSIPKLQQIDTGVNVIVIGLGPTIKLDYLTAFSPRVFSGDLNQEMADAINGLICAGNTDPGTLPPTTIQPPTTTPMTTSPTTTTHFEAPTTTITPFPCPDCVPNLSNIVIVLDATAADSHYSSQIEATLALVQTWNHFERVGLAAFADTDAHYEVLAQFGDLRSALDVNNTLLYTLQQYTAEGNITSAFKKTLRSFEPIPGNGPEKTIFFTNQRKADDISSATSFAETLRARGQVIIIGIGMDDVSALSILGTDGDTLAWPEPLTLNVTDQIMNILGSPIPTTTPGPTTSTATTSLASTTTTAPMTTTSIASTSTTTTTSGPPCKRAVILLIDESSAIPPASSGQLKDFSRQLIAQWSIDINTFTVAALSYTRTLINVFADFNVRSTEELLALLEDNVVYKPNDPAGVTKALHTVATFDIPKTFSTTTILLTASSQPDDLSNALKWSEQLRQNGSSLITVSFGPADASILSSGDGFGFSAIDYKAAQLVGPVNGQICMDGPLPPTTQPPSTTTPIPTTAPTRFACNADVAILIDSSSAVGSMALFQNLIDYIALTLTSGWPIDKNSTEVAAILYSQSTSNNVFNSFNYSHASDFGAELLRHEVDYYGTDPSIDQGILQTLKLPNRRTTHPRVTILFTYSSNYDDLSATIDTLDLIDLTLGGMNLIVIGLGGGVDGGSLIALSPRLILPTSLNDALVNQISDFICQGNTIHGTLPTTTTTTTTMATTTSVTTQTTTPRSTTTFTPICPDCIPRASSVLVVMDASNGTADQIFDQQSIVVKKLAAQWTHFERIALAAYASKAEHYEVLAQYGDLRDSKTFNLFVDSTVRYAESANITVAFKKTTQSFTPVPNFGQQQIIFFITSKNTDDIASAIQYSQQLQQLGPVIVVLIGSSQDLAIVSPLASINDSLAWEDVDDTDSIVQQIEQLIDPNPITLPPTTTGVTSATSQATVTTTSAGESPATTSVSSGTIATTNNNLQSTTATFCSDCTPPMANLLVIIDASTGISAFDQGLFNEEAAVISLGQTWNHFERVAIIGYPDQSGQGIQLIAQYGDMHSINDLHALVSGSLNQTDKAANVASALDQAMKTIVPVPEYGSQKTILFLTQTDQNDLTKAIPFAQQLQSMGSLTVIGVGMNTTDTYSSLGSSGDALTWPKLTDFDSLIKDIDATLEDSTSSSTTSLAISSTTPPLTTSQGSGTTATTAFCSDCDPPKANLLLIVDASTGISAFDQGLQYEQAALVGLVQTWNHFERVAIIGYPDGGGQGIQLIAQYGDIHSIDDFYAFISVSLVQTSKAANLSKTLDQTIRTIEPLPEFGSQKTILFLTQTDQNDLTNAIPFAQQLQSMGSLTVIGVGMNTTDTYISLGSSGDALTWPRLTDFASLVQDIDATLADSTTTSPPSTPYQSTASQSQMTTSPQVGCSKNVLILLDASASMGSSNNFDQMKSWLKTSLIPSWDLSQFTLAFGTFSNRLNMIMHFGDSAKLDEIQQLIDQATYLGNQYSLDKVLHEAIGISPQESLLTTLIITENGTTGGQSVDYSNQLKVLGNTIGILAIGSFPIDDLIMISSGPNFIYETNQVPPTQDLVASITSVLCLPAPTLPPPSSTITTPPSTTSFWGSSFDCQPDLMLLIDDSTAAGRPDFERMIDFLTTSLVSTWNIGLDQTEAAAVLYCQGYGTITGGLFDSVGANDFQRALQSSKDHYYGGEPSISEAFLIAERFNDFGRGGHNMTYLLFTFSSDYNHVLQAVQTSTLPDRLIVIAMESSPNITNLMALSENVVMAGQSPDNWDSGLADRINEIICQEKPGRETLPPTPATTEPSSTPMTTRITFTPPITTVSNHCPDCMPAGNLLFIVDAGHDESLLQTQIAVILTLANNWNHWERVAVGAFRDSLAHFEVLVDYNSLNNDHGLIELTQLLSTAQYGFTSNLSTAFRKADTTYSPSAAFGRQQTVVFTTTQDANEVQKAQQSAYNLQKKGNVILVGAGIDQWDQGVDQLATTGEMLLWQDTTNINDISARINNLLNSDPPTTPPSSSSTTAATTTSAYCSDCSPPQANLLLLFDCSMANEDLIQMQAAARELVTDWNHFERVAMGQFSSSLHDIANYRGLNSLQDAYLIIDQISPMQGYINLTSVLSKVPLLFEPLTNFVVQRTIIFTTSGNDSDIISATPSAEKLKEMGSVTVVGIQSGIESLQALASPGMAYSWMDTMDITGLVNFVLQTLGEHRERTGTLTASDPTCKDCQPPAENILLIIDTSSSNTHFVDQQIALKTLVADWNHFERIGVAEYGSILLTQAIYGEMLSKEDINHRIADLNRITGDPNITYALSKAIDLYSTTKSYPIQRTILFTSKSDVDDIEKASLYAQELGSMGSLSVIGVGISIDHLSSLTIDGYAYSWMDTTNPTDLVNFINQNLGVQVPISKIRSRGINRLR